MTGVKRPLSETGRIEKPDGGKRPHDIPTLKDRVLRMALKLVIEPIFEADFKRSPYGFTPGREAVPISQPRLSYL